MPGTCEPCPGNKKATLIGIWILPPVKAGSPCEKARSRSHVKRRDTRHLKFFYRTCDAASSTGPAASLCVGNFQGMTAARCPRMYAARPVRDFSSMETSFLKGEPPYRLYR